MRILLVNRLLSARTGTEVYLRDLANELKNRGNEIFVFTPSPGCISDELEAAGVPVFSDPAKLPEKAPDIIHAHHTWETLAVAARYPRAPIVFVGHDMTAWHDTPPRLSQIRRYVCVDPSVEQRFLNRHGIEKERVLVIPNPIDFSRFPPRSPLPSKPRKALLLSNYAGPVERDVIAAACLEKQIELDAVGKHFGNQQDDPGSLFSEYDIVFGKGRCGLEAAQAGCAVVFCDTWGCGPLLQSELLLRNEGVFPGRIQLSDPLTREVILDRLSYYDADDAAKVAGIIRNTYDSMRVASLFENLYEEVFKEGAEIDAATTATDLARELSWWSIHWETELSKALEAGERLRASSVPAIDQSAPESISFGDSIRGEGWYEVEVDSRGPFRWMSPSPSAWIELTVPENVRSFEFTIAHVAATNMTADLRVMIQGRALPLQFAPSDFGIRVVAKIPEVISLESGESERIFFHLPRTVVPAERDPSSSDTRFLGVALRDAGFVIDC